MKTICIAMADDGYFNVYEQGQDAMGGEAAPAGQTVKTIDEALSMAKQMLAGGANSPEALFAPPAESMQQGFEKARGTQAGY